MAGPPLPPDADSRSQTLYALLGVSEDASAEDLTKAYRQKALTEHPDKGGDATRFDELAKAFQVLGSEGERDAYDERLAREREREKLVELPPGATRPGTVSDKQAQAPMRAKTEPVLSSKRQGKLRNVQAGQTAGPKEWRGLGSAATYLKMLTDDVTEEQKTERLLDKYAALPKNKEKRREWLHSVKGKEKQDLKAAAKRREEVEREKWAKWLAK
mmetsp:Transcript_112958/g.352071  ORF Transcript_112958/g.352071 Transcript_112958/m.352071 type:complete len:215 (-) Transcript_112958:50-694(-)